MMQSIKDNRLDPGDSLYVITSESDEDYIVLGGNRRLSALKVLTRPDLLDGTAISESSKKALVAIANGFDRKKVEPIRCVLFEMRNDANNWIYRRHTGAADGEGRIDWGPLEQQRFAGDRSTLDVIDFVGRNGGYTPEQWAATKDAIEKKSTNLSRLLESAYGRKHLGLSVEQVGDQKIPSLESDPSWALAVLKRLVADVSEGVVDSRDLNKASDIEKYFKGLPESLQPLSAKAYTSKAFKDISLGVAVPSAPTTVIATKSKSTI
jgi:hypothetical protein